MARGFDPVQDVVAKALEAMPQGGSGLVGVIQPTQRTGVVPATTPGSFNLFAGQGATAPSYGAESSQPRRQTTSVF